MSIFSNKKSAALAATLALALSTALSGCAGSSSSQTSSSASQSASASSSQQASSEASSSDAVASADSLRDLTPVTRDDVNIVYNQFYDDEGSLNLEITEGIDAVKSVHFLLFLELGGSGEGGMDADEFLYLGEDNNMDGDYETGQFKDNFNGYWATIGDTVVTAEVIEETEEYTLYSVPCIIDETESSIRAMYEYATSSYKILGRYDGVTEGSHMTSRGVKKVDDGAQVVFTLASVDAETFEEYEYQMPAITWSSDLVMEDTDLGDGTFMYMYEIEDVFGNEIDADAVEIKVEGDDITWLTDL